MKIISDKNNLIKYIHKEYNLGFIPTMGAIHAGHKSLIRKSINQCNKTVVTIFINKPQFDRKSDFKKYPRLIQKDILILKKLNVDYLYLPSHKQIYPNGHNKNIKIHEFKKKLCGKFRAGHFEAIVDVVDRFIKIINPKKIYFGEKDFQQLKIIENFVKINHKRVKVVGCKTIREKNGIACSSRNFLLSPEKKHTASRIYKLLVKEKSNIINKKIYLKKIKNIISKIGVDNIEYIEFLDINKIIKPYRKTKKYKIFIAYYLNSIRLIDNI